MKWAHGDHPAERAVDFAATALFAAAVGFALGAAQLDAGLAVITAAFAGILMFAALRNVPPEPHQHALPDFEPAPIELVEEPAGVELLLEDELGSPDPDSRVVRLFDPKHGSGGDDPPALMQGDASEALSKALAELRRSLR